MNRTVLAIAAGLVLGVLFFGVAARSCGSSEPTAPIDALAPTPEPTSSASSDRPRTRRERFLAQDELSSEQMNASIRAARQKRLEARLRAEERDTRRIRPESSLSRSAVEMARSPGGTADPRTIEESRRSQEIRRERMREARRLAEERREERARMLEEQKRRRARMRETSPSERLRDASTPENVTRADPGSLTEEEIRDASERFRRQVERNRGGAASSGAGSDSGDDGSSDGDSGSASDEQSQTSDERERQEEDALGDFRRQNRQGSGIDRSGSQAAPPGDSGAGGGGAGGAAAGDGDQSSFFQTSQSQGDDSGGDSGDDGGSSDGGSDGDTGGAGSGSEGGDRGSGDDSGSGGDADPMTEGVSAEWVAPEPAPDADIGGFATQDLFLAFENPVAVVGVTSSQSAGLRVINGAFHQNTQGLNANVPPSEAVVQAFPTASRDSFLTIGGEAPFFPNGGEPNPEEWGSTLEATWLAPVSNPIVPAQPDPARFGDGRFYLWIARISAGGSGLRVEGQLQIDFFDLMTGVPSSVTVTVPNCPECWQDADGSTPEAALSELALVRSSLAGGASTTAVATLTNPAPPSGVVMTLATDRPDLISFATPVAVALPNQLEAIFDIETSPVSARQTATIFVSAGEITLTETITVEPIRAAIVRLTPGTVTGGESARGEVELNGPAPAGGVGVDIVGTGRGVSIASLPTEPVRIRAGETSARFDIHTSPVAVETTLRVLAGVDLGVNGVAVADLRISPLLGDVNGDGVVNARDLNELLGRWGDCPPEPAPCPADLNGDRIVNARDSAELLGRWGMSSLDDDDDPDAGDDDEQAPESIVRMRWVAVDNTGCVDLAGMRTADLYAGFLQPHRVNVIESVDDVAISISGGAFHQDPLNGNRAPLPGIVSAFPCAAFDSYLAIEGEVAPRISFLPNLAPNPLNWGSTLMAGWFVTAANGGVAGVRNPTLFGDNRFYVRLGRVTASSEASVAGRLRIFFVPAFGSGGEMAEADVPPWTDSRGVMDINRDGTVDAADVSLLVPMMGSEDDRGDVNEDGAVSSDDLLLLLDEISG